MGRKPEGFPFLPPGETLQALAEPGHGAVVPGSIEDLDGASAHLPGLGGLAPVLVEDGEALVAERAGVADRDRRPTVLDETRKLLSIAAVAEMGLGEADVGEAEIPRIIGQV